MELGEEPRTLSDSREARMGNRLRCPQPLKRRASYEFVLAARLKMELK